MATTERKVKPQENVEVVYTEKAGAGLAGKKDVVHAALAEKLLASGKIEGGNTKKKKEQE